MLKRRKRHDDTEEEADKPHDDDARDNTHHFRDLGIELAGLAAETSVARAAFKVLLLLFTVTSANGSKGLVSESP